MNFGSLVINAIRGQMQIVVRQLMDVGLLNAAQDCAKDHDGERLFLQEIKKNNGEFSELHSLTYVGDFTSLI